MVRKKEAGPPKPPGGMSLGELDEAKKHAFYKSYRFTDFVALWALATGSVGIVGGGGYGSIQGWNWVMSGHEVSVGRVIGGVATSAATASLGAVGGGTAGLMTCWPLMALDERLDKRRRRPYDNRELQLLEQAIDGIDLGPTAIPDENGFVTVDGLPDHIAGRARTITTVTMQSDALGNTVARRFVASPTSNSDESGKSTV